MKSAKYHDINNQPKKGSSVKDYNQQIYLLFKGEERLFMEEEAKIQQPWCCIWMRECLVGSAGEQTSELMTTYLGIPRQPPNPANLGVVYGRGSAW
jgi:hypothetical protein